MNSEPTQTDTSPFLFTRTKLRPPRLRSDILPRPRLVEAIRQAIANVRLALVSAPAGYGKTTLVADAVSQLPATRVVWLTVDGEDDEPLRFLSAFTAALQPVAPAFVNTAAGILAGAGHGDQRDPILLGRAVMTVLINELFEDESPLCLVIDDLHYVVDEAVHIALNFLIDRLPPHVTLVIATRHDPPLTLAQLRARRELVELRLEELRFTDEETITLLNSYLGLQMSQAEVVALHQRTEGWAAGMTLLSASLRRLDSATARRHFLDQLHHTNRYIFDYLAEAVFGREDAITQDFLVATAILDELSVPVCQAVSGRADAERILNDLYRRNLFLIGSESSGQLAYRYHDLFRSFLQERAQRQPVEQQRQWHVQAAQALTQPARKVQHFLLADAFAEAADSIEQSAPALVQQGWAGLVRKWIQQLPPAVVDERPRLAYWLGTSAFLDWDVPEIQRRLTQARLGLRSQGLVEEETAATVDLAVCQVMMNQTEDTTHLLASIAGRPLSLPQQIQMATVQAYLAIQRADVAQVHAIVASIIAQVERQPEAAALNGLAQTMHYPLLMEPGGLANLERLVQLFTQYAPQNPMLEGMAHVWQAHIHRLRGDWEGALAEVSAAQAVSRRLGGSFNIISETADKMLYLSFLGRTQAAEIEAQQWFAEMSHLHSWAEVWSGFAYYYVGYICWEQGRIADCRAYYARMVAISNPFERGFAPVMRELMRGLLLLADRDYPGALAAFTSASSLPTATLSYIHQAQTLTAYTYFLQGKHALALDTFAPVLAVYATAGTPGAIRMFGACALEPLLIAAITHHVQADFARRILAFISPNHPILEALPRPATTSSPTRSFHIADTGETLTEREIEVLRLIARGADNATIAETMIVSIHTVKTHVAHILGKLGVPSRTAAAIKARELGLVK